MENIRDHYVAELAHWMLCAVDFDEPMDDCIPLAENMLGVTFTIAELNSARSHAHDEYLYKACPARPANAKPVSVEVWNS